MSLHPGVPPPFLTAAVNAHSILQVSRHRPESRSGTHSPPGHYIRPNGMRPASPSSTAAPYGQRLLTHVIDERARQGHARPYASIPRGASPSDGFQNISYGIFANAIDRCAYWVQERFGLSTSYQTIAYIGPLDMRYNIFAMAAVKTGFVVAHSSTSPYLARLAADEWLDVLPVWSKYRRSAGCLVRPS